MKKILFLLLVLGAFLLASCTNIKEPCPLNMINPDSCEFGTYTTEKDGCSVTSCRPGPDFTCKDMEEGDSYFDGCNTCNCINGADGCTKKYCPPDGRIDGEGEMCGGIAGIMCKDGLRCMMEGNYPDAAGTCVRLGKPIDSCPKIAQPGPEFCPDGTIKPRYDDSESCIIGYSCAEKTIEPSDQANLIYSCTTDSDCEVMNVGNCCGYYPKCLNKDSVTDPEGVAEECKKNGLASVCGFPSIDSCSCVDEKCVAN